MRNGLIAIAVLLTAPYCRGVTNEVNVVGLVSVAISPGLGEKNSDVRGRAMNEFVKWRNSAVAQLIAEVEKEPAEGEDWWNARTPRNVAMRMLGTLRAAEAIPALIKWLRPRENQSYRIDPPRQFCPAAIALMEIGYDAVGPVIEFIATEGDNIMTTSASRIVSTIIGVEGARTALEKRIATENDGMRTARLKEALKAFTGGERSGSPIKE